MLMVAAIVGQAPPPEAESRPDPSFPAAAPADDAAPKGPGLTTPSGAIVAVIPVEGLIYDFVLESLERRIERALDSGASVVVIELDTPGGVVTSALDISKYIKTLPVQTVAWINNDAYSAGIMIASACDQIVMSKASATGDCAPIMPGKEMAEVERAKALSPILEEFRDNATNNNYDYALFHAMCVLDVKVYLVEHKESEERRLINQADYRVMVKGMAPAMAARTGGHGLGGLLGLGSKGEAAATDVGGVTLTIATDADRGQWETVDTLPSGAKLPDGMVHDGKTLLTLNQTRAHDIGLSKATISKEAELRQYLSAKTVFKVNQSWSENMAGYLTHPVVRLVLIIGLMLGAYVEFQTPGIGIAGAVAATSLILLLGAPFLVGLAEMWHIIMFLIGFVVLVVELAFMPSFGLLGVMGLIMMFAGLVLSIVPTGSGVGPIRLPPPEMWNRLLQSTVYMMLGVTVSFIGFYFITKHFGRIPLLSRLILSNDPALVGGGLGAARPTGPVSGAEAVGRGRITVGATGRTITGLRPSGRAKFDGQAVDVVTVGNWIERGRKIKVVAVHGNRIVVDANESSDA